MSCPVARSEPSRCRPRSATDSAQPYHVLMEPEDPDSLPLDSLTEEPATFGESSLNVLTPMGQVESFGHFAHGLGARRVKIALVVLGLCVLIPAVVAALS